MRTLDDIALPGNERRAIEAAAAALPARVPVSDIVLFGAKARGDSAPHSGIDLLVLTDRRLDGAQERAVVAALFDIGRRYDVASGPRTVEARSWRQGLHSVLAPEHGTADDAMFKLRLLADYTPTDIDTSEAARTLAEAQAIVAGMHPPA